MKKTNKTLSMATLVASAVLMAGAFGLPAAPAQALDVPRALVDVDWVEENMDELVVIDVRKDPATFTKTGHIPGARVVKAKDLRMAREFFGKTYEKMRPTRAHFQKMMRALGVNKDSTVVLTNRGEKPSQIVHSTLLYWQLKYFGFDNVAILDGGNAAWEEALMDVSTAPMGTVAAGDFEPAAQTRENMVATLVEMEETVAYGGPRLVDTRGLDYFMGMKKKSYVSAAGHIPGASVFPYSFVAAEEGPAFFRPVHEQVQLAKYMGVDVREPMIVYCNSGNLATANWFVAHELIGNKDVRLYDGSMHQWTLDPANATSRYIN